MSIFCKHLIFSLSILSIFNSSHLSSQESDFLINSLAGAQIVSNDLELIKPSSRRLNKETPLHTNICNYADINGSTKNTSLLMLIPAAALKSGRLSSCALYEAIGDIEGNTIKGMILKDRNSIDDYVRQDCAEITCRARNADLISQRAQEIISLTKEVTKTSRKSSAIKNIEKIGNKYNEFHIKYGDGGAKFNEAEKLLSERLEGLIVNQFNELPISFQQSWIIENEKEFNSRIDQEITDYNYAVAKAKAAAASAAAAAAAKAKAAIAAAEKEKAAAKAAEAARARAAAVKARAEASQREAEREKMLNIMFTSNQHLLFLLFLMAGYIAHQINKYKTIVDTASLKLLEPSKIYYFLFFIFLLLLRLPFQGVLLGYSQVYWVFWAVILFVISFRFFNFHNDRYLNYLDKLKKIEKADKARKAKAAKKKRLAEEEEKAKAEAAAAAANAKAKAEAESKAKKKAEAELKIKQKEKEIATFQDDIQSSFTKKEKLENSINKAELEIQVLEDSINDEKDRFKKLVKKYPFLAAGKIIKNR